MTMKKRKFSMGRKGLAGLTVVIVFCLVAFATSKIAGDNDNANSRPTDAEIARDLVVLEDAVWNYFGHKGLLPESLSTVEVRGLKGNPQDYTYHLVQQYEGGPNESFALCSTFHSDTRTADTGISDSWNTGVGLKAFMHHESGQQCLSVSWNINANHSVISLMQNTPD